MPRDDDSTNDRKPSVKSGHLSKTGSRKSAISGAEQDVPLQVFATSTTLMNSRENSVKSSTSLDATSMQSPETKDDPQNPTALASVTNEIDERDERTKFDDGLNAGETTDSVRNAEVTHSSRKSSKKSMKGDSQAGETTVTADILTNQTEASEIDLQTLSSSPVKMVENDLYEKKQC